MKVIDILNKRANNEELPQKIKYYGDTYILNVYTDEIERIYVLEEDNDIGWFSREYFTLHSEVEVIEENPIEKLRKDLEELKKEFNTLKTDVYVHIHDILSHNGSPITLKTGIDNVDSSLKFGDTIMVKNDNGIGFVYDDKGVTLSKDKI